MGILYWVVFGLIAGSIANFIDPAPSRYGILGSIVLGIVGAVVGGWIGSTFLGLNVSGFNLTSFIVAVLGSLLVLWVGRMLTRGRGA
jgi:uncharacterized membrane protein YeaQ/YmgE (transglycosylase-associated protein family)